jgi:hypothetical protein
MDLLLLSCSATKRCDAGLLPAIDRYDGPGFRVLRKALREQPMQPMTIWIVSAEFGLITSQTRIPYYDRRMTALRAVELRPHIAAQFQVLRQKLVAQRVLLHLSPLYASAIEPILASLESLSRTPLDMTSGEIGVRLGQLKRWLYCR